MRKGKQYFILVLIACLVLSDYSITNFSKKNYPMLSDYKWDPGRYNGTNAVFFGNIRQLEENGFLFEADGSAIRVIYKKPIQSAKFGTTRVFGYYSDGVFRAIEVQNLNHNNYKYLVSAIGLFIVFYLIKKEWKLGIPLREKNA